MATPKFQTPVFHFGEQSFQNVVEHLSCLVNWQLTQMFRFPVRILVVVGADKSRLDIATDRRTTRNPPEKEKSEFRKLFVIHIFLSADRTLWSSKRSQGAEVKNCKYEPFSSFTLSNLDCRGTIGPIHATSQHKKQSNKSTMKQLLFS